MADEPAPDIKCSKCEAVKPATEYFKGNKHCKTCKHAKRLEARNSSISYEQEQWELQGLKCAICAVVILLCDASFGATETRSKAKKRTEIAATSSATAGDDAPVVVGAVGDHCHRCNFPRGMLCGPCNLGLGHFRDSPTLMLRAAAYIKEWKQIDGHLTCPPRLNPAYPSDDEEEEDNSDVDVKVWRGCPTCKVLYEGDEHTCLKR